MGSINASRLKTLATEPGRHRVDDGLYLLVREGARPTWVFRYVAVGGKRRDMAIGSFETLSLPDARAEVLRWQRERESGRDPIEVRKAANQAAEMGVKRGRTLREYATEYHELQKSSWKNQKHSAQWLSSLHHLGPLLDRSIDSISSADLLDVLELLNKSHHETATRVRQRIEAVYDRAMIAGIASANPATPLKRALRAPAQKEHFASMPYSQLPAFLRRLRDCDAAQSTRLGFEWLILGSSRTTETIAATWSQINADRTIWTIPAELIKTSDPHQVPITQRMREILLAMEPQRSPGWDWLFPSPQGKRNSLSNGAFLALIRRMGLANRVTAHGMRASFSTWAYENTNFRGEIIEAALAHSESNAVKAAYNRASYWSQRIELAEAWNSFCLSTHQP